MARGTLLDYRLCLFGVPMKWRTRIEGFETNEYFIDVQLAGSKWKNPALIASLLFTVLALINISMVIRVKGRKI